MITTYQDVPPTLGRGVFVAESALVLGRVILGDEANVWYGCVLRGDVGTIRVGARTNIQDLSVVHVTSGTFDTTIGADVTVGHRAILHGCTVEDLVLVGMGAILLDGSVVEPECIIGAGALVSPGTRIPSGSLALGSPAKVVRRLKDAEREHLRSSAQHYVALAREHQALRA
jgi:carbonic anhydrase/acetyltransferase-like protein (isoleucine patch superfamily)